MEFLKYRCSIILEFRKKWLGNINQYPFYNSNTEIIELFFENN